MVTAKAMLLIPFLVALTVAASDMGHGSEIFYKMGGNAEHSSGSRLVHIFLSKGC